MPCMNWSGLDHLQLGKYAEYYAKMEFTSYGYEVYTSEVDDHGVDFIAKAPVSADFYEVQVKSVRKTNYAFISKNKIIFDNKHLVCFMKFKDGEMPVVYVIPITAWAKPNAVLVDRNYDNGKAEWGINYSEKNQHFIEQYKLDNFFMRDKSS